MVERYIASLQTQLDGKANTKTRDWWQAYVKQSAPFRGVKMALIRTALHNWYAEQNIAAELDLGQQKDLALAFLRQKHAEDKIAGTLFLQEILLPLGAIEWQMDVPRFAALFAEGWIYDWNTCDWFCIKVLSPLIQQEGMACAEAIAAWRDAEPLWQARASVVAFVKVAANRNYYPLVEAACAVLIRRQERFAKTAVGWILRDISKHNADFVSAFIDDNLCHFSLESLRNATKTFAKSTRDGIIQSFKAQRQ
jgi:3-methyladenine DNA glycosylase AlkD